MQTIKIIMTHCKSSFGLWYIKFTEKDTHSLVGEVDFVQGKYVIFSGPKGFFHEIGSRTKKKSAIKFLQDHLRTTFTAPVEFEWE